MHAATSLPKSWVNVPPDGDFSLQNLPWGVFQPPNGPARLGMAIGEEVVDLAVLAELGAFHALELDPATLAQSSLNAFIAQGKAVTSAVRQRVASILAEGPEQSHWEAQRRFFLHPQAAVKLLLPVSIGDYTDFYASLEHATNVGALFRDPANALLPNWRHLPVAYHGRASSIVVSETSIRRPWGQYLGPGQTQPHFAPTQMLDFELELAYIIGKNSEPGQPIPCAVAEDYVFGLALFNDWSARDIQQWEYAPLGPFLGKNFASTLAPWIVPLEALEPFRTATPPQHPAVLPYLQFTGKKSFDIQLEAWLALPNAAPSRISATNFSNMYWNISQQIAHHTINGCNLRIGDVLASGTLSGPGPNARGCMLEITHRGNQPLQLPNSAIRTFLEDGDGVILRGFSQNGPLRIGFGAASGQVLSANPSPAINT